MLLPENKLKQKDITPKNYFIWGQSMSGKTYLARSFPNPLIINTDGNALKVDTPSIIIADFKEFVQIIKELEEVKHTFETIIIDLVDDIKLMLFKYVCDKYKVDDIGEVAYGKGYRDVNTIWQNLMIKLSQLPFNIIFISHIVEYVENNTTYEKPSLEQKYYNMCMGRCDINIKCRKVGNNFLQICESKRERYKDTDIKDKKILNILKGITGVIETEGQATLKKIK